MSYVRQFALRYLGSRKRSFVSLGTSFATVGVALGVAALCLAVSVSGGFQSQFRDKILGVNAHVLVLKYSIDFREYRDVMKRVEAIPGVVAAAPFVINPTMVSHGGHTATGVLLKGIDPSRSDRVLDLPRTIVEGNLEGLRQEGARPPKATPRLELGTPAVEGAPSARRGGLLEAMEAAVSGRGAKGTLSGAVPTAEAFAEPSRPVDATPHGGFASTLPDDDVLPAELDADPCAGDGLLKLPSIAIGRALARQLDATVGSCLLVTSPTIGLSIGGVAKPPVAKRFRVIALFEAGFDQYDSKLAYADLYEAQAFYEYGDSVTGIETRVADIDRSKEVVKAIELDLQDGVYHVLDWMDLNRGLFTALVVQRIGVTVVLGLILVVAAFTVVATLVMIVLEKQKEIALLKAIGAPERDIVRIFLWQGLAIGTVGTALGLVLGGLGCAALLRLPIDLDAKVYFISQLPVRVRAGEWAAIAVFSLLLSALAALVPARHAARAVPAEGLRPRG
jgi:lipoprotein-releasing system permease protein